MTAYKVIVAERKDMLFLTVVCPECRTSTSFDRWDEEPLPKDPNRRFPTYCPFCKGAFGDFIDDDRLLMDRCLDEQDSIDHAHHSHRQDEQKKRSPAHGYTECSRR